MRKVNVWVTCAVIFLLALLAMLSAPVIGRQLYFFIVKPICPHAYEAYVLWGKDDEAGDLWKELLKSGAGWERRIGSEVLSLAEVAFSDLSASGAASEEKYGSLARFCPKNRFVNTTVKETHELELVTAHVEENSGYLWIVYSQQCFDNAGDITGGSSNILSRWTIQKQSEGLWEVTDIFEHP